MTDYDLDTDADELRDFVVESNRIEGIEGTNTAELMAAMGFLDLAVVEVSSLCHLVSVFQPGAMLRNVPRRDVCVGNHTPPPGGEGVLAELKMILMDAHSPIPMTPYEIHLRYETLHPFMDGNGCSGRMLWAWQMLHEKRWPGLSLGFLHAFYYQTLEVQGR